MASLQESTTGPAIVIAETGSIVSSFFSAITTFVLLLLGLLPILLFLILLTIFFVFIQNNYAQVIQDLNNDPTLENDFLAIINFIIASLNFCIAVLRFIINLWDYFLPFIYQVAGFLFHAIEQVLEDLFNTPSLQCIISELFTVFSVLLQSFLIAVEKVFNGFERGLQAQIQRDVGMVKQFKRAFVADRTGPDNSTLLRKKRHRDPSLEAQQAAFNFTSANQKVPGSEPGTDGTCPSQSALLDKVLPVLVILIQLAGTIGEYLAAMFVEFLRITIPAFINLVPQVLQSLAMFLKSFIKTGIVHNIIDFFRDLLASLPPAWTVLCPLVALTIWGICALSVFLSKLLNSQFGQAVISIYCDIAGFFASLKRNESIDDIFTDRPQHEREITDAVRTYYTMYSPKTAKDPDMYHHHSMLHRHDLFRPSDEKLLAHFGSSYPEHEFSIRKRNMPGADVIASTYEYLDGMLNVQLLVERYFKHLRTRNFREMSLHAYWRWPSAYAVTRSPTQVEMAQQNSNEDNSNDNNSGCGTSSAAEQQWGSDDDSNPQHTVTQDRLSTGSGSGGLYNKVAAPGQSPNEYGGGCKQVMSMCACTSGSENGSDNNEDSGSTGLVQCEMAALKQLIKELGPLIMDIVHITADIFETFPALLKALVEFLVTLSLDVVKWVDELAANEGPLLTSLYNLIFFAAGLPDALRDLDYSNLTASNPQQMTTSQTNLNQNENQKCPSPSTLEMRAADPRCPEYHCLQKNGPELCFFPNQNFPGKTDFQKRTGVFRTPYLNSTEPISRAEFLSLTDDERVSIRDRYNVRTLRNRPGFAHPKIMGRVELGQLRAMYHHLKPSQFGVNSYAYREMVRWYEVATQQRRTLAENGLFRSVKPNPYVNFQLYSYDAGSSFQTGNHPAIVDADSDGVDDGQVPVDATQTCQPTTDNPSKCCSLENDADMCCYGLIGCIPSIPADFKIKQASFVDWIGNITETTCKPFDTGLKEMLFIFRLTVGEFSYVFIEAAPTRQLKAFWNTLLGWTTFENNEYPPFALVCFVFNLGGLFILIDIIILLAVFYISFSPFVEEVINAFIEEKEQDEIRKQQKADETLNYMMYASPQARRRNKRSYKNV